MSKLKNITHDLYKVDQIKYTKYLIKDCSVKKKDIEYVLDKSKENAVDIKNIGYVRLTTFSDTTTSGLEKSVNKIKEELGKKFQGLILDLRNNPGGLLNQSISVTDSFLNQGEIVSTQGRKDDDTSRIFAKKGDIIDGKPMIVLINSGSASASEIVAGALKDHKRAIIIGENSYGKGSVQSIIPLKNKGAIRLTVSKYYLPSGKSISEIGVSPDIEVAEGSDDFRFNTDTDNQLQFALELLNG